MIGHEPWLARITTGLYTGVGGGGGGGGGLHQNLWFCTYDLPNLYMVITINQVISDNEINLKVHINLHTIDVFYTLLS